VHRLLRDAKLMPPALADTPAAAAAAPPASGGERMAAPPASAPLSFREVRRAATAASDPTRHGRLQDTDVAS
jgi:hypothetical protein